MATPEQPSVPQQTEQPHIPAQPLQPPTGYGYPQPGSWAPVPEPAKKLSTGKKIGIGVGGTLGLVLLAAVFGAVSGAVQNKSANTAAAAAAAATTPMPHLVGKTVADTPAALHGHETVNQRSAFGGTDPVSNRSDDRICFQEPAAGAPLASGQDVELFVAASYETCPTRLGDLRAQPTPTPTPAATGASGLDKPTEALLAAAMAPGIVEGQWAKMDAATKKQMCDVYNTPSGPILVRAMFLAEIKPGTEGYEYKDVLGDAFMNTLKKNC
ncbi:hypothetical protein OG730_09955 [Streptomyces sp. NBC_01298]|uniref:hypothetical protein n=1 Tax=Streptomyces sp. NBC_01298 TaxID=2903817 RepID=UPI002E161EF4|nr:hypothetical protein OG730_09955 [Streptomyces sp. NBC_01298]